MHLKLVDSSSNSSPVFANCQIELTFGVKITVAYNHSEVPTETQIPRSSGREVQKSQYLISYQRN